MSTGKFDTVVFVDDLEIDVTLEYDATYQSAKISGPPEDCYPADGQMDITSCEPVMALPEGITNGDLQRARVQQADRLENEAWEHYHTYKYERDTGEEG